MNQTLHKKNFNIWRYWGLIQGVATLTLLAALIAGWYPTHKAAGTTGLLAMFTACAITWVASGLSMVPVFVWMKSQPKQLAQAILAAGAIRFILVLLIALPLALLHALPVVPFLLWVGISYLAVLAADTAALVYLLNYKRD